MTLGVGGSFLSTGAILMTFAARKVTNNMGKTELLSPAGDMPCLKAAIAAGADAVYLGGQKFGARAFAGNFNDDELLEALKRAHFFDRKIYLTVNTLHREEELEELVFWLAPFYEAGLDGVIIQDMGVLERCRRAFPGMPLHASTQMTVTEARTALFLKEMGVSRIVPARELSLEEIAILKKDSGLELETFIHGALCYSYSGQCLFSSLLGGRSGNRGRCAQPCRLPYQILSREPGNAKPAGKGRAASPGIGKRQNGMRAEQYPLSLKDLCVLPLLPKLMESGIDSFKIEGRMKSPEYVAGVTAMYRKYMDLYESDPDGWQVEKKDLETLTHLYVRSELSSGYYEKHNGREMVTLSKPGYAGAAEEVLQEIRETYLKDGLTRMVDLKISLMEGAPAKLTASCGGTMTEQEGMIVMPAQKKPLAKEDVERQLKKTGGSRFLPGNVDISLKGEVFLPVSALNELRRQTLETLYEKMTASARRAALATKGSVEKAVRQNVETEQASLNSGETALYVSALEISQAMEALKAPEVCRIYLSADTVLEQKSMDVFLDALRKRKAEDCNFSFFLTLPVILRVYSEAYFKRLMDWLLADDHYPLTDGLQACSLSGALWAEQYGFTKALSFNHSAYVFNTETWSLLMRRFHMDSYTAPLELNRNELKALPAWNMEVLAYGRIPMMQSAGCLRKTAGDCRLSHTMDSLSKGIAAHNMRYYLKDRYQAEFPVLINCNHCMNTIYNSVPLSLHQYQEELRGRKIRALRLDFTDETDGETSKIIRCFADGSGMPPSSYTTGHYKKGVQ